MHTYTALRFKPQNAFSAFIPPLSLLTATPQVTLTGQTGAIYSVDWSLDGDKIASSSREGTVWIWDAESGKAEKRLSLHSRGVHRVQWDPFHRTRLASAGADKKLVYVPPVAGTHHATSLRGLGKD